MNKGIIFFKFNLIFLFIDDRYVYIINEDRYFFVFRRFICIVYFFINIIFYCFLWIKNYMYLNRNLKIINFNLLVLVFKNYLYKCWGNKIFRIFKLFKIFWKKFYFNIEYLYLKKYISIWNIEGVEVEEKLKFLLRWFFGLYWVI